MSTIARSHILTPALWRTLTTKKASQAPTLDPLLFLSQGALQGPDTFAAVKLRTIRELNTLEALVTVYIEGTEKPLTTTVSMTEARLYATTQDIIHQNGGFHSVIFKVISDSEGATEADIYLWEIPSTAAPDATESDLPLYLPKGSTFYVSPSEEDIVMDRTFRISEDHQVSVNIRTVEGRGYSTTVTEAEAVRYVRPGDFYVESGSEELSIVYGVTTQNELPLSPIIKHTVLPAVSSSRQDLGA